MDSFDGLEYYPFHLVGMEFERRLAKSLEPISKHGKTKAQKKKEIAKRRKRKKNKQH